MTTTEALLQDLTHDAPVRNVLVGAFWTLVTLETDPPRAGLASTLRAHTDHQGPPVPRAGRLHEYSGRELAAWLRSTSIVEASIGMGAYNALLQVDQAACLELNAETLILERGSGLKVAIVGHFPFVDRVRQVASTCWVLEQQPRPGDHPSAEAANLLPQADVVALTGTSLINHTFDDLLGHCRPDAFVVLLGATAPLSPILLERGVDAVSGTLITDVAAASQAVAQGATFRQIPGKRLLTMMRR